MEQQQTAMKQEVLSTQVCTCEVLTKEDSVISKGHMMKAHVHHVESLNLILKVQGHVEIKSANPQDREECNFITE